MTTVNTMLAVLVAGSATMAADRATTSRPMPVLADVPIAKIHVWPDKVERTIAPTFVGINLNPAAPRAKLIEDQVVQRRVKAMGIATVRFPNGCVADTYSYKSPPADWVTVEQFLTFCEAINAEPYYTLNLQGGTAGREGPVPAGANLDERIRYRHTAPNPCGDTKYHFGTLTEALDLLKTYTVDRALAGKRPITHYELGNENWGQSGTDWIPEVYGKTCEIYAAAFRKALAEAKATHPELGKVELYIVAVGFPSMGNNQDPFKATDRAVNVAWTREMNRLADAKLIDAVQEHCYPYGNADGSTLLWTVHNLSNILHLRYGVANPRLGGYQDPELAYHVPVEWTEWNVKCWGPLPDTKLPLVNGNFEVGATGWTVQSDPVGSGTVTFDKSAARRGAKGLHVTTVRGGKNLEVRQAFSVADRKPAAAFGALVWVRTNRPGQTSVTLRQANDGPSKGTVLGTTVATQMNMWERISASGAPKADTTAIEVVLRVQGEGVTASFDEVVPAHWPTFSGMCPLVATGFEQQLFMVDFLRTLLAWPTPRTHVHHLFGNYPCATLAIDGMDRDNAASFKLLNKRIGDRVVKTECVAPTFDYDTNADKYATDFNALAPDMKDVPAISALATRDDKRLYLLLVNRTSDRPVRAEISLSSLPPGVQGDVRTLSGMDFDVAGAAIRTAALNVSSPLTHTIPPHCAQVLSISLIGK